MMAELIERTEEMDEITKDWRLFLNHVFFVLDSPLFTNEITKAAVIDEYDLERIRHTGSTYDFMDWCIS